MFEKAPTAMDFRLVKGLDAHCLFERALRKKKPFFQRRELFFYLALLAGGFALLYENWPVARHPIETSKSPADPPLALVSQRSKVDTPRAIEDLKAAAAAGDIDAKIELGERHLKGLGVPRDKAAAARLFTEAAEAGSARADSLLQLRLQIQCLDHKRVHDYWLPLAEAGDPEIMSALGELYMRGRGVPKDPLKAIQWFERAIEAGYLPAHVHLVKMYSGGRGIPPDPVKKVHHLRKGAEAGRWDAISELAWHLLNGEGVERNPEEAFALALRAAEESDPSSRALVGRMYAEGLGVRKSIPDAVYWLRTAADNGLTNADIMLESLLKTGKLPPEESLPKCFADLLAEAEKGRVVARHEVGILYIRGQGTPRDEFEGTKWILQAAEDGFPLAQRQIAEILKAGRYIPQNLEAAAHWGRIAESNEARLPHIPANDSEALALESAD